MVLEEGACLAVERLLRVYSRCIQCSKFSSTNVECSQPVHQNNSCSPDLRCNTGDGLRSTEAVTGIVGRAELLSALCVLLSLESYRQGRWLLAVALTKFAYGCKETGLLGFALFVWMDLVRRTWKWMSGSHSR